MELDRVEDTAEHAPKRARTSEDEERFVAIEKEQQAQGEWLTTLQGKIDENKDAVDGVRKQVSILAEKQHVATLQSSANWHNLGVLDKKAKQTLRGYKRTQKEGDHCYVVYVDEDTERYASTECVMTLIDGQDITWESEPLGTEDPIE